MTYFLLLVTALLAVLWLASALDRHAVPEVKALIFSPPGGAYDRSQLFKILPSRPHTPIVFTTNGSMPTAAVGTLYERPLRLDSASPGITVVRAREFVDGVPGPVQNASYSLGVAHTLPILSIIADPADLWDPERGNLANDWQRGQDWERPVYVTYIEGDHSTGFEISAGLRIHPAERVVSGNELLALRTDSYGGDRALQKQSFRLYFRQEYGAARLEYPLFPEHQQDAQSYKRLLLQAGDKRGRWTLLEEQLLAELVSEVDGNVAQGRSVLLFLNGEPWGIYRLSEWIDRFFLEDQFGIPAADLIRHGKVEEGDGQNWEALMNWLATHNLNDPINYSHLQSQIELDRFTDAAILQMYLGFSADNLKAARPRVSDGRWLWLFGDGQAEAGLAQNAGLALLGSSDNSGGLTRLLSSLIENSGYRTHFVTRVADLLNTTLAPAAVQARIDRLAAQLQPDIDYETTRWPASLGGSAVEDSEWERNVAALRAFAQDRPIQLRRQIIAEFGLRGTATLTFSLSAPGNGYGVINGSLMPTLPWTGTYFLDTNVQIIAMPAPGYGFVGWEEGSKETSASQITFTVGGPRRIAARFAAVPDDAPGLRPNDVIINEYWINDNGTRYSSIGGHPIEGDWLELFVTRSPGVDLRGWRITDNDTKTATSEGSIILPALEVFAAVPRGTFILIVATESNANAVRFPRDDLDPGDGQMVLYVGNGHLDVTTDPGFNIGTGDENLALLAPGSSPNFADDVGVDFIAEGDAVTPLSFGALVDGVTFDAPFRALGNDDGALFTGKGNNDNGAIEWIVDPAPEQSGDSVRPGADNLLTPGAPNYGQYGLSLTTGIVLGLLLAAVIGASIVLHLRTRRG